MSDPPRAQRQHRRRRDPVPRRDRRRRPAVASLPRAARPGDLRRHVPGERARGDGRLPPPADPPRVPDPPWLRYTLAVLGSLSLQGAVIDWVADHRKHHTFTDEEGDPHSPHAGSGRRPRAGCVRGLWHAHVGWLFETHGQASSKRFAPDLVERPDDAPHQPRLPADRARAASLLPFLAGLALSGGSLRGRRARARCCGQGSCGSSSCTTSPGASTRSATSSARAASTPTTSRPTSSGSPCPRSARPGTTTTTPSRSRPSTGCAGTSSTPPAG